MIFCLSPSRYYQARPEGSSIIRPMFSGSKGSSCSATSPLRLHFSYLPLLGERIEVRGFLTVLSALSVFYGFLLSKSCYPVKFFILQYSNRQLTPLLVPQNAGLGGFLFSFRSSLIAYRSSPRPQQFPSSHPFSTCFFIQHSTFNIHQSQLSPTHLAHPANDIPLLFV